MELKYRVSIPFGNFERGQEIDADQVTEDDLHFNRVVPYHYSAPPPQQEKETPPPHSAAATKRRLTTTEEK